MRLPSNLTRTVAAAGVLALLAAACGGDDEPGATPASPGATASPAASPTGAAEGGSFSVYLDEPEHLSPPQSQEEMGIQVLEVLFTGLIEYDHDTMEPILAVAESIETEDEGQTWTITIEEGWTFHNGEEVTAQSFVDSWNWTAYGPNGALNNNFFANFEGYEAVSPADPDDDGPQEAPEPTAETLSGLEVVDDTTFTVTLATADPTFDVQLGYIAFMPLPQAFFDDPVAYEEEPVGNGPYMIDGAWEHDVGIDVVKYEDYGSDVRAPNADAIEFQIIADLNTAYNEMLAGNLDLLWVLPPEQILAAEQEFGDHFDSAPDSGITYLGFPMYSDWIGGDANQQMRAALSMAIDREAIAEAIFQGGRLPANTFISPVIPGHRETVCDNWENSPEMAQAAFEAAGGVDALPDTVDVWFNSGAGHDAWVEAVTNQWNQVLGIPTDTFNFQQLEFSDYLPALRNQQVDGPFRLGWGMDYPHPQNYTEPQFFSENAGVSNFTFYSNPDFDQLIRDARGAGGLEQSIPLYQEAETLVCEDVAVAPIYNNLNQWVWSDNISNVFVNAQRQPNLTEIQVSQ